MSSPSLDELIQALTCLPGVGHKSAQRMALHLLERDRSGAQRLVVALQQALEQVGHCQRCRNFSDTDICQICSDDSRDDSLLCVVESPADVIALESAHAFRGRYFVMLGRLSPLDGLGPEQLGLEQLEALLDDPKVKEIILATSATVEGDITANYIADLADQYEVNSSRLARGIPVGGELEFVDSGTLSRALAGRQQINPAD